MSELIVMDDDLKIADPRTGVIKYRVNADGVQDFTHPHDFVPNQKLVRIMRLWLNDVCTICGKTRLQVARGR
jgi:hypothetical protein